MEWEETSPCDEKYNCIAYAAGETDKVYWPHSQHKWPRGIPNDVSLESFKLLFRSLGYQDCVSGDPEAGYDKVALYALFDGTPTHAAIYCNGKWRSKCGVKGWDISHDLTALNGEMYGYPVAFLKKRTSQ